MAQICSRTSLSAHFSSSYLKHSLSDNSRAHASHSPHSASLSELKNDLKTKDGESSPFNEEFVAKTMVPFKPIVKAACLFLIFSVAFSVRMFSVIRYESIIHEFDPWYVHLDLDGSHVPLLGHCALNACIPSCRRCGMNKTTEKRHWARVSGVACSLGGERALFRFGRPHRTRMRAHVLTRFPGNDRNTHGLR